MTTIAYCNPFIPPEWIAAHGMQPSWMQVHFAEGRPFVHAGRAICPYAAVMMDEVLSDLQASAVVLTTTCDQMRYAAAMLESQGDVAIFLMNVPSTWQTDATRRLYQDELKRLGRFLVRLGGQPPTEEQLADVMLEYDKARANLRDTRSQLPARQFAEAIAEVRMGKGGGFHSAETNGSEEGGGVPLAIVGGPLIEKDFAIFDLVEQAGGRLVLDATEGGERTLPAVFDRGRVEEDPLDELVRAYFGAIPDVFRRPNDGLYEWLGEELASRQVRGVLLHRYVWCDIWHAETARLKEWSPVPVLEIDECDDDASLGRTAGRIEAFLEMLT
ncbi:MAG: 2-hydroxyacyl-CoA dehydratase [Planctomycetes bacterium]|nr:2-hydroxyacyl-CoA dehydratase [Planctomycetota bacterium]